MRHSILKACCVVLVVLPAAGAEKDLAGEYVGDWSGVSGSSGEFRLKLQAGAEGKWICEVTFTFGGAEVETKVTSVGVDGGKFEAKYEFDLGDAKLESTIRGQAVEGRLEGKYTTKALPAGSAVDEGVWRAARRQ